LGVASSVHPASTPDDLAACRAARAGCGTAGGRLKGRRATGCVLDGAGVVLTEVPGRPDAAPAGLAAVETNPNNNAAAPIRTTATRLRDPPLSFVIVDAPVQAGHWSREAQRPPGFWAALGAKDPSRLARRSHILKRSRIALWGGPSPSRRASDRANPDLLPRFGSRVPTIGLQCFARGCTWSRAPSLTPLLICGKAIERHSEQPSASLENGLIILRSQVRTLPGPRTNGKSWSGPLSGSDRVARFRRVPQTVPRAATGHDDRCFGIGETGLG